MEVTKVEGFSDGVFGVAMTLLVYQLVTPRFDEGKSNSELLNELGKLWPQLPVIIHQFLYHSHHVD